MLFSLKPSSGLRPVLQSHQVLSYPSYSPLLPPPSSLLPPPSSLLPPPSSLLPPPSSLLPPPSSLLPPPSSLLPPPSSCFFDHMKQKSRTLLPIEIQLIPLYIKYSLLLLAFWRFRYLSLPHLSSSHPLPPLSLLLSPLLSPLPLPLLTLVQAIQRSTEILHPLEQIQRT